MLGPHHLPFNALRGFEVAARTGSFVNAGRELGVSAAAVSQQVKALEAVLGKQLFLRQGNRITLTDAGRTLYPSVENALTELRTATLNLRAAPRTARLLVSVMPSLADLWLLTALRDFAGRVHLDLRVEEDPVDLAREGVDLRLCYGGQYYTDHIVDRLFSDALMAYAAPGAGLDGDPAKIPDSALIHTDWGPEYGVQPDWARHFEALGLRRHPDQSKGLHVGSTTLAASAARAGLGVALLPQRLAAADVQAGSLTAIGKSGDKLPRDYVLITGNAQTRNRKVQALRQHLLRVAGQSGNAR